MNPRFLAIIISALISGVVASVLQAAETETGTLQIAERVLNKGFSIVNLSKYPGMLMLHGMGEMALVQPEKKDDLLRRTIELFKKYRTKEIKGGGSFICYEAGGTGAAMLRYRKVADVLSEQVDDSPANGAQTEAIDRGTADSSLGDREPGLYRHGFSRNSFSSLCGTRFEPA